ncbi:pH regulation protein F [Thauera sp. CAU 1555]|uniref:PH regulation protein F n=1 Tax=Thauera sedimentorum TaxID=2767595 RepID=A0ABR9B6H9_9RHOO|nr:monovalent cation/H+ antiporter complex subunit F [Thauera sedimentorum]MBC9071041.1 pH regulation protein F [Thauera sedimentorum]MBD8501960.1 pH regulation protein F [Thauera sedimentorum]
MTVDIVGAGWVLPLAFLLLAISAVLVAVRLLRGPTAPDRVVAIDALALLGISVVGLLALATAQSELLDVAVVLALVSFLGTTAFMLLFAPRKTDAQRRAGELATGERREGDA